MLFSLRVLESIGAEDNLVAVLDDGFAGNEYIESAWVGVVDSELMAVEFKVTILATFNEHCWFDDCCLYSTVFEVFEEQDLSFLQYLYLCFTATNYLKRSALRQLFLRHYYLLWLLILNACYGGLPPLFAFNFLLLFYLLHSKISISSGKLELLLWLCLLSYFDDIPVDLFESLLVVLPVIAGQNIVDLKVIVFHFVVMIAQSRKRDFCFPEGGY